MIEHRSYIVAEIPDPVRSQIQVLRDSLNTPTRKLPVEITLAGSSGVGPIPVGTDLSAIQCHMERILSKHLSISHSLLLHSRISKYFHLLSGAI